MTISVNFCKKGGFMIKGIDPVHVHKDGFGQVGWYFWDETWADRIGPYETEEEAREKLAKYCIQLDLENYE
jgi:hypothetical protein